MNFINLQISPQIAARYLRIFYVVWTAISIFGMIYVPGEIIIEGDISSTIDNIQSNEFLFRSGIAMALVSQIFQVVAVFLLFQMFRGVSRRHNTLLVALGLLGVPIAMFSNVFLLIAISAVNSGQSELIIELLIDSYTYGFAIASIFWGLWLFPLGYLVYKSCYFPKFVGFALVIGGIGYLVDTFTHILLTNFAEHAELVENVVLALSLGEMVFVFWLIIIGAKMEKMKS